MGFLKKIGLEPFVIMLFLSIALAWVAPEIGIDRDPFSLSDIATWGVAGIFFFYGVVPVLMR